MQDRREEIIDFLNENYQPVYMLHPTLGKVDIWPLVRIKLYFSLIRNVEDPTSGAKAQQNVQKSKAIKWFNRINAFINCVTIKEHDKLLLGATTYRVLHQNKSFNRYFDPRLSNEGVILEYSGANQGNYYSSTIHVNDALVIWSRLFHYHTYILLEEGHDFLGELIRKVEKEFGYSLVDFVDQLKSGLISISKWESLMGFLIKKTKATQVIALCYYTNAVFGAFLAASARGINKIDMQHGPQTNSHGAYGKWKYVLQKHSPLMPNEFWTWDRASAQAITSYSSDSMNHKAIHFGNEWIHYWSNNKNNYAIPEQVYLLSLQPIIPVIPKVFLLFMKDKIQEGVHWWVRLHPRQSEDQIRHVQMLLNEFLGGTSSFTLDYGFEVPLPLILKNTLIHFTGFSGTAVEAALFNVHTYFFDKRASSLLEQNSDCYHWFADYPEHFGSQNNED